MKTTRKTLLLTASVLLLSALFLLIQRGSVNKSESDKATGTKESSNHEAAIPKRPVNAPPREADRLLKAQGARTDVSLSQFPIKEYQHLRPPAGKAAGAPVGEAYIHVPSVGRRVAMEPNQVGEFPSIPTKVKDTVGVRLALDGVKPRTPVRVVILDGGSFPTAKGASRVLEAADWRGVAFEFTTSENVGTHRVLVQAPGQPSRILDFSAYDATQGWPEPALTSSN